MKNLILMKRLAGLTGALILLVSFITSPAYGESFPGRELEARKGVPPDKTWTISFNVPLNPETIEDNIYVLDENSQIVPTKKELYKPQVVKIDPLTPYLFEEKYYIYINGGLESKVGSPITGPARMMFQIKTPGADSQGYQEIQQRTKEEIREKWEKYKPAFKGDPFIKAPLISPPYSPGKLEGAFIDDGRKMTNFVRYLAGLPDDVETTDYLNEKAQHGALLQAANDTLTHYPSQPYGMEDSLYQAGYESSKSSNIMSRGTLSRGLALHETVLAYMADNSGYNLKQVGHRKHILNPKLKYTGFGLAHNSNSYYSTMQVLDRNGLNLTNMPFIMWPSPGYFPGEVFNGDHPWSLFANSQEYYGFNEMENLEVFVERISDGKTWHLKKPLHNEITSRGNYLNTTQDSIIFRPGGVDSFQGSYKVTLKGIEDREGREKPFSYTVSFFDL